VLAIGNPFGVGTDGNEADLFSGLAAHESRISGFQLLQCPDRMPRLTGQFPDGRAVALDWNPVRGSIAATFLARAQSGYRLCRCLFNWFVLFIAGSGPPASLRRCLSVPRSYGDSGILPMRSAEPAEGLSVG